MMSNHPVQAAAEGTPALTRRAVLTGGTTAAAIAGLSASACTVLASIPTWMELRIEAHRDAHGVFLRTIDVLDVLKKASQSIDRVSPPAWLVEAERDNEAASEIEAAALLALMAERPRSIADVETRARYLLGLARGGELEGDPDLLVALLGSMTGQEG